ncbi:MAG TPA: PaaI family thioesterase, partial [Pusillimonas sp.]
VEFKINLVAPARGDYLEAVGKVLRSGRTLTICQLEVHAVLHGKKELVAIGQQTLMCMHGKPDAG